MMLVLHSLAWHARGVKEDAETIKCDPSLKQIAELAHVSPRACQYALKELETQKTIGVKRRGHHTSNVFTISRSPISDMQHGCIPDPMSVEQSRHATTEVRHATEPPQTRNEAIQTCNMVASSGVDPQEKRFSGAVLQGEPKSKAALFSVLKSQSQKREPKLTHEQKLARSTENICAWLREHGREAEIPKILEAQSHAEEIRKAREAAIAEGERRMAKRTTSTYQYDPDEEDEDDREDEDREEPVF